MKAIRWRTTSHTAYSSSGAQSKTSCTDCTNKLPIAAIAVRGSTNHTANFSDCTPGLASETAAVSCSGKKTEISAAKSTYVSHITPLTV